MTQAAEARAIPVTATRNGTEGARGSRSRRRLAVEYRIVDGGSVDALRRRELELERLIIKAACHRAARLASSCGTGDPLAGAESHPGIFAADRHAVPEAR